MIILKVSWSNEVQTKGGNIKGVPVCENVQIYFRLGLHQYLQQCRSAQVIVALKKHFPSDSHQTK